MQPPVPFREPGSCVAPTAGGKLPVAEAGEMAPWRRITRTLPTDQPVASSVRDVALRCMEYPGKVHETGTITTIRHGPHVSFRRMSLESRCSTITRRVPGYCVRHVTLKPVKPVDNVRVSGKTERSVPPLIRHLEQHLGPIAAGWRRDIDGREIPFQVALFENAPGPGNITLTTIGLSNYPLEMVNGRVVHQELVFACHEQFKNWNPQVLLQSVGRHAVESRHALLRGQCLGPLKLFAQSEANGIYSAIPVYFPDSFNSVELTGSTKAVFTWLVPIYPSELELCRTRGWSALEAEFELQDPDLMDLERPPLSIPAT